MANILVTRPEPGGQATSRRLEAMGHSVLTAPLFTIRPLDWTSPEEPFEAIMLTSANAPPAAGQLPKTWLNLPCHAVGEATARAARAAGFGNVFTGTRDVAALVLEMERRGIRSALHLSGRDRHSPPSSSLRIITRAVYAAEETTDLSPATAALENGTVDVALLYSPRAARHFAALVDGAGLKRDTITIGALSNAVARAAGQGWRDLHVPAVPNEDDLFAACGLLCDKPGRPEQ